jgi:hypothetical protein
MRVRVRVGLRLLAFIGRSRGLVGISRGWARSHVPFAAIVNQAHLKMGRTRTQTTMRSICGWLSGLVDPDRHLMSGCEEPLEFALSLH